MSFQKVFCVLRESVENWDEDTDGKSVIDHKILGFYGSKIEVHPLISYYYKQWNGYIFDIILHNPNKKRIDHQQMVPKCTLPIVMSMKIILQLYLTWHCDSPSSFYVYLSICFFSIRFYRRNNIIKARPISYRIRMYIYKLSYHEHEHTISCSLRFIGLGFFFLYMEYHPWVKRNKF